jgi:hypothetical protein
VKCRFTAKSWAAWPARECIRSIAEDRVNTPASAISRAPMLAHGPNSPGGVGRQAVTPPFF